MKNNYGFGKFEVLTVIVVLLGIFAFLAYSLLGGVSSQKLQTMKDNANSFSRTVANNMNSFHNTENVYLGEAVDEQIIKKIKNPVGGGYCSLSESFVHFDAGMPYVTFRCGDYLIENVNFTGSNDFPIYKVSDWSEKKTNDDDEEIVLYNCTDNGKQVFDEYYQELYFVYLINKKYNTDHFFASTVDSICKVEKKTFYRTKEEFKAK